MTRRDDIDEELRFHVESRVRDLMAEGRSARDAQAQAEREFGDRASFKDQCAGIRRVAARRRDRRDYWNGWRTDLRYGMRSLVHAPLFSIAAISMLTVGIGLASTVFAVVHGVFLNPLPYPDSRELHRVYATNAAKDNYESPMSAGDFFALRESLAPAAITIGGYMNWPVSLTGVPDPERLTGALASADLFKTLGVSTSEGRTFLPEDEDPSRNVVIISTRLAARLGLTGRAAGATIELGRQPAVVVGVMPSSFQFPQATTDVWVPLALRPADRDNHSSRWLHTIARVPDGTADGARDRLATSMARLATEFPAANAGWSARLVPLHDVVVGLAGSTVTFLALAIACVLLVMVVNLATLVTSRLQRRTIDLSVQQALGADRWRLLRQLGTECLVMTAIGGALGLLLASGLVGLFQRLAGTAVPRAAEVSMSPWMIAFAIAIAMLGLLAMTIVPLWRTIAATATPLAHATRGVAAGRPSRILVIVQSALAIVLMVAAGLLAQTYLRLINVDLGFNADDVLTMRIALPAKTPLAQQASYFGSVVERVQAVPGVVSVGAVSDLPLSGNSLNVPIAVAGGAASAQPGNELRAGFRVVTPGYLETIGARVRGRSFDAGDVMGRPLVALVNEAFANTHWPGGDAIGMRVRTSEDRDWRMVVGVVRDIRHAGPTGEEGPAIFVPHAQKSEAFLTWMSLAIRTNGDPLALAPPVRAAITNVDRHQPVSDVGSLDELVIRAVALPRLAATIAAVAAVGSLVLAALGIGAVLSLLVSARTPDFAVRLALGAPPARLKWTPVVDCVLLVSAGGGIGLIGATFLARLMRSLLFGVSPLDTATFAVSLVMLLAIAMVTAIAPARAIARIDPTLTLRS